MRKSVAVAVLMLFACPVPFVHGQKTRVGQGPSYAKPGVDYPLKAHIIGIHIRPGDCGGGERFGGNAACNDVIYADINVNGQKIECLGGPVYSAHWYEYRILPGDYQARALKSAPSKDDLPIHSGYELLLPEKRAWGCSVTGILE
jgi:hypothetical protein